MSGMKVDELQKAASSYGGRSLDDLRFYRTFKDDLVEGFAEFLAPGESNRVVIGVPPWQDWDPDGDDYRDEALDNYAGQSFRVGETTIGLAIKVDNSWIRERLRVHRTIDCVQVTTEDGLTLHLPLNYWNHLHGVFEALFESALSLLTKRVLEGSDLRRIGFKRD